MSLLNQIRERMASYQGRSMQSDYVEAGVLLPVTKDEYNPEIILTKRSDQLSTHRGQVAFPGGRKDPEDVSLLATALRESEEEIALPASKVEVVGALSQVISRFGIVVSPFVGLIPAELELQANPEELESVFRVPVSFFLKDERKRTDVIQFKGVTYRVPCYQYEQYEIWGLSAIILVEFLNAAFDAQISILDRT